MLVGDQQQAGAPRAGDHRHQPDRVERHRRAQIVEAQRLDDRRFRIVGVPPRLVLPDIGQLRAGDQRQPVMHDERIRHAVKRRLAAERLLVLVVQQHAAQLDIHQGGNALGELAVDFLWLAELAHGVGDLLEPAQLGDAR